jgi:hypothetical protein
LTARATSDPKQIQHSIAHWNIPDPVHGLAVRHEDQSAIPIDVLDSDLVQLFFVPHAGVAYQDDHVTEKLKRLWPPVAFRSPSQEFLLRFLIKPK